jgi:hypothetical protein
VENDRRMHHRIAPVFISSNLIACDPAVIVLNLRSVTMLYEPEHKSVFSDRFVRTTMVYLQLMARRAGDK